MGVHWFLLAALVLLPVTGYLFSTLKGGAVPLVAGLEVPVLVEVSKGTAERIYTAHTACAYCGTGRVHVAETIEDMPEEPRDVAANATSVVESLSGHRRWRLQ